MKNKKKEPEVPIETIIQQLHNRILILKIKKKRMEKLYEEMINHGQEILGSTITEDLDKIKEQINNWEKETRQYEEKI